MYSNATIEARRLEQPQILFLMTTISYKHRTSYIFLVVGLEFLNLHVYYLYVLLQRIVLLTNLANDPMHRQKLVQSFADAVLQIINDKGQR